MCTLCGTTSNTRQLVLHGTTILLYDKMHKTNTFMALRLIFVLFIQVTLFIFSLVPYMSYHAHSLQ
jgi:hypothetical protein